MAMHRKNKGHNHHNTKGGEYQPWFWWSVLRRRMRKGKAWKKLFKRKSNDTPKKTVRNLRREGKNRCLDGTMEGPFRTRGTA